MVLPLHLQFCQTINRNHYSLLNKVQHCINSQTFFPGIQVFDFISRTDELYQHWQVPNHSLPVDHQRGTVLHRIHICVLFASLLLEHVYR